MDPLHGRRVHFWVLVLAGSRSVTEHFFIDPLSGKSYPTDNDHFLGVESVWNNLNYYINMQDCGYGCEVSPHTHTHTPMVFSWRHNQRCECVSVCV